MTPKQAIMKQYTKEEKEDARKLQATLTRIACGDKFFFNITQFKNAGLIYGRDHYGTNSAGNRERMYTTWHLTEKAKQFLNVVI